MWRISLTMAERPLRRATAQRRALVILFIFAAVSGGCSSIFGTATLTLGTHPRTLVAMRYSHFPYLYVHVVLKGHQRTSTWCPALYLPCSQPPVSTAKSLSSKREASQITKSSKTPLAHTSST